jgi:4'-phosphopantetheinyl transferase
VVRGPFQAPEQDDRQGNRTHAIEAAKGLVCELVDRDIHVWPVELIAPDFVVERCFALLSPDERARAERFVFEHHRHAYALSRGVLRALLGRYISLQPAGIHFSYGSKGKPYLSESGSLIRFNCSHSGGMALYAITRHCDLGIDIEKIRPLESMKQIAQRFFCPEEVGELLSLTPAERQAAFFRCWSRKEAYIKAVGDGLSIPLDGFRVTLTPGGWVEFVHLGNDRRLASEWALHDFTAIAGYAGAIAYHEAPRPLCVAHVMTVTEVLASLEGTGCSPGVYGGSY